MEPGSKNRNLSTLYGTYGKNVVVYDNKAMTGSQLLQMIKLDVEQFANAWGNLDNHDPA
jgi:hypothetical protein